MVNIVRVAVARLIENSPYAKISTGKGGIVGFRSARDPMTVC